MPPADQFDSIWCRCLGHVGREGRSCPARRRLGPSRGGPEWSTPFIAVPLYLGPVDHASYGGGGSPDFLGLSTRHTGTAYAPGPHECPNAGPDPANPHALRSLADVGLLPSGLLSLRYDLAAPGLVVESGMGAGWCRSASRSAVAVVGA